MMKSMFAAALLAATMLSSGAMAQQTVTICTGGKSGNYYAAGNDIAAQLKGANFKFEVLVTGGSMDNFRKLTSKECQFAIVQQDTIGEWASHGNPDTNIEEIDRLYTENFHLLVNSHKAKGVSQKFGNLDKDVKVMRDGNNSGTAATWNSLVRADKARNPKDSRLASIPTVPEGGIGSIGKLRSGNDAQALIFMSGVGSGLMKRVDAQALDDAGKKYLCLVDMDDSGMFGDPTWKKVQVKGKPVYEETVIDSKSGYTNILCDRSSIKTFGTSAIVVADREWKASNSEIAEQIAEAVANAVPNIKRRMNPPVKK